MTATSDRIKQAMDLRNIKQADLVEITGISKGALSSYLSGRYNPKQGNLFLLAKALDVNEAWLMGADVPMERKKSSAAFSWSLSPDQEQLLAYYDKLNPAGKAKVREYASDLTEQKKYTQDTGSSAAKMA